MSAASYLRPPPACLLVVSLTKVVKAQVLHRASLWNCGIRLHTAHASGAQDSGHFLQQALRSLKALDS